MQNDTDTQSASERRKSDRRQQQVEDLGFPDRRKSNRRAGMDRRTSARS